MDVRVGLQRKLSAKDLMLLNCGVAEDSWESLGPARRSKQSILKEISPEYSLEGLMLKLKRQYFGHLMWRTDSFEKTLMLGKIEGRRRRGRQRMRCWMASLTQWSLSKLRELVMDREAWRAAVYAVMKRQTWLSNWTELHSAVLDPLSFMLDLPNTFVERGNRAELYTVGCFCFRTNQLSLRTTNMEDISHLIWDLLCSLLPPHLILSSHMQTR